MARSTCSSAMSSAPATSVRASRTARSNSSSFRWTARPSLFCVFWSRMTRSCVVTVSPVVMTSCQVSPQWKTGPDASQMATRARFAAKKAGDPTHPEVRSEKARKAFVTDSPRHQGQDAHDRQAEQEAQRQHPDDDQDAPHPVTPLARPRDVTLGAMPRIYTRTPLVERFWRNVQ